MAGDSAIFKDGPLDGVRFPYPDNTDEGTLLVPVPDVSPVALAVYVEGFLELDDHGMVVFHYEGMRS